MTFKEFIKGAHVAGDDNAVRDLIDRINADADLPEETTKSDVKKRYDDVDPGVVDWLWELYKAADASTE